MRNKTALITGASSGIGREFAKLLAQDLSMLVLVARNRGRLAEVKRELETGWMKEEKMIAVNVTELTQMTKLFVKDMVERKRGRVLNVASTAALQPGSFTAVYHASKAYVLFFSEAIANELKGTGVTVSAFCPGPTDTGFATAARMERTNLFTLTKPATAAAVARFG